MDRLVKPDVKELDLSFSPGHRCSATFRLTNLMHTMSVAVSLTTTNPSLFSFTKPFSILPPLSSAPFTVLLSQPSDQPPFTSSQPSILVRTSMLPVGKAPVDELRRIFSKPGKHVFRDASIPISLIGPSVVKFLVSDVGLNFGFDSDFDLDSVFLKAVSGCDEKELNELMRDVVASGRIEFIKGLIEAGGDVNYRGETGESEHVMAVAVRGGSIEVVRVLLGGCKVVNSVDRWLHDATGANRIDILEELCNGVDGIDVNSIDLEGKSPIHVASSKGYVEAIRYLVSLGGDVDLCDLNGWSPLHCASAGGHLEAARFLLGCCLYGKYSVTSDGKSAFALAVENGHSGLFDLLQLGDVLQRAARIGDVHGMKSCLAEGAEVNERDQNGWTPLHRASFKGRIECVKLLLNHGARVDLVDDNGYTALHCAVEAGHVQVALCLIANGARANLKSFKGVFPFNLDSFVSHPALVLPPCRETEQV